jgi:hypothetical protein
MMKTIRDIRKIKTAIPVGKSAISLNTGFGPPVRLIQLLEKNKIMREVINRHFHSYNMLSPAGIRAFFSGAAVEKQLSRMYENFYREKLETERHYYKSRPTMAYKMLKAVFDYDSRKVAELVYRNAPHVPPSESRQPADRETRQNGYDAYALERNGAAGLTMGNLPMIIESVLAALARERRREERRKGK